MTNETKTRSDIALDIDSLLAIVQEHLHRLVGGESVPSDTPYNQGLVMAVEQARNSARELYGNLCSDELELLDKLTQEQRLRIVEMIEDAIEGNMNIQHLTENGAPRIALARFEAKTANMTAEECAKELERMEIYVTFQTEMYGPDKGMTGYAVTRTWTLKGLQEDLARMYFLDSVQFYGEDQTPWQNADGAKGDSPTPAKLAS